MKTLLDSAQDKLNDALSGKLSDPCGAAIMAMYDALMSTLTVNERRTFGDHPNAEAARLAATDLALPRDLVERVLEAIRLYYDHRRSQVVTSKDAVRLAKQVLEAVGRR